MRVIEVPFGTTVNLQATIRTDGALDTGATVTISITLEGAAVVTDQAMTHQGSGVYEYEVANDALTELHELYEVVVTAVSGDSTSRSYDKLRTVKQ